MSEIVSCPNCGKEVRAYGNYCPWCSSPLRNLSAQTLAPSQSRETFELHARSVQRRRHIVIIGLIAIIIVSLGLIAAPVPVSNFPVTWFLPDHKVPGWSGYVVVTDNRDVSEVAGSWTVPSISCSGSSSGAFGIAVGIDGYSSDQFTNLAGVVLECRTIGADYAPVYSWGGTGYLANSTIQPRDRISVDLSWKQDHFETIINDNSRNWTARRQSPVGINSPRHSAEWMIFGVLKEDGGGKAPVPNFGTVSFFNCHATIQGTQDAIDAFPLSTLVKEIMVDNSGNTQATPSLPSWPDGSSFSVQWNSAGT